MNKCQFCVDLLCAFKLYLYKKTFLWNSVHFTTCSGLAILQVYIDKLNARRPPDTKTILHKNRKRIAKRGKNLDMRKERH